MHESPKDWDLLLPSTQGCRRVEKVFGREKAGYELRECIAVAWMFWSSTHLIEPEVQVSLLTTKIE